MTIAVSKINKRTALRERRCDFYPKRSVIDMKVRSIQLRFCCKLTLIAFILAAPAISGLRTPCASPMYPKTEWNNLAGKIELSARQSNGDSQNGNPKK